MVLEFLKTTEADLKRLFPVINYEDYRILQGQEVSVDPNTYKKFISNKFLQLGEFQIPEALIKIHKGEDLSEAQVKVQEIVSEKFIYSESVVDILMAGIEMGKNVLLYGRGGHGKSEITQLVLDTLKKEGFIESEPFVQAFGDGMTEDKLFGGMNIIKYREEGVLEFLPEYSFLNHEIVVFEEIFDAPPQVLLSLKDVMTSGYLRNGNQRFKAKTKVIIGLTNKSKEDFSESSDSLKALAERFPLTYKTEWSKYGKLDFMRLFKKVFDEDFYTRHEEKLSTLADIIDLNNVDGVTFVSPRTAVWAAQIYCAGKPLEYISEIDKEIIAKFNKQKRDTEVTEKQNAFIKEIEGYIDQFELEVNTETEEFLSALAQIDIDAGNSPTDISSIVAQNDEKSIKEKTARIKYLLDIIDRYNFTEKNFKTSSALKKKLSTMLSNIS